MAKNKGKRDLLFTVTIKDCDVQTFRSGGPGGQHQNTSDSGVRVKHRDSGAVAESREGRSQHENKRKAFSKMARSAKFEQWIARKVAELDKQQTIEQRVDEMMKPENIRLEVKQNKKWIVVDELPPED